MSTDPSHAAASDVRTETGRLCLRRIALPSPVPASPALVTGVFDLLHLGHVRFLAAVAARSSPLLVGVESDARVRAWKGRDRPVNPQHDRAELLAALSGVDGVFVIEGDPAYREPDDYVQLLAPLQPGAYAFTAGDPLTVQRRHGAALLGAAVWEMPAEKGYSTTALIDRLQRQHASPTPVGSRSGSPPG